VTPDADAACAAPSRARDDSEVITRPSVVERGRHAARASLSILVLSLSSCASLTAAWDVARQAAVPAAAGFALAASGATPVAVGAGVLVTDVTLQAVEGAEVQAKLEDAAVADVKERIVKEYLPPTVGMAWQMWKWAIVLAFLASWWFPTPRAWWIWWLKRRAKALQAKKPPADT
jgi:hypothetical protein